MPSLDCYFYLNIDVPEDDRFMETYCSECTSKLQLNEVFFWQGSIRGYGDYKIDCKNCKISIHDPEEE